MLVALAEQMKEIDRYSIEELKIPGIQLMENAGQKLFNAIRKKFGDMNYLKCLCLCGKGNNGGDGFVAARYLKNNGADVRVLLTEDAVATEDAKYYFSQLEEIEVIKLTEASGMIEGLISESDIIIDAVFGTGFKGKAEAKYEYLFEIVNNSNAYRVSADVPSGCICNNGEINGACFKADLTVTFGLAKPCHFLYPSALYTGELVVSDIGLPDEAIDRQDIFIKTIDKQMVDDIIKPKKRDSNKGVFGKLLSVCGSKGMSGAAFLAASGALRTGVGLITAAIPECIADIMATKLNETLFLNLKDNGKTLNSDCKAELFESLNKSSSCLIGCGTGINEDTKSLLFEIVKTSKIPLVIDADGITMLKENINVLSEKSCDTVLTPHPGEMARLLDKTVEEVQRNRINYAMQMAVKYNTVVTLKGAHTIVAAPDGMVYINLNGNPGLAKGGSGDVLAGMTASFLAQGFSPVNAAISAVYIHGKAADKCAKRLSEYGMLPSDMLTDIAEVLNKYNGE